MKVLAIDTSTYALGLALLEDDQLIGEYTTDLKVNHSLRVMPAIEHLLSECGVKPKELGKIVVAKGPGSYTGVRIGVTIAKTLAWTLNIPLSGVSSLAALASSAKYYPSYISPIFDARRGRVYTGLYHFVDGKLEEKIPDQNVSIEEWCAQLRELKAPVLFAGSDVGIHQAVIQEQLPEQAVFGDAVAAHVRPSELGRLGLVLPAEDLHTFVPNYIRMAEAEVKWLEAQQKDGERT
ncbi:tRNA threonylcarbamoyladenosine biosynthesis protein TsaB [Bacillus ectoiniformans]|uniref:tRNA (adenosine(37)-N6)-threonylcarbamoyltransferase complex dimerization subunit type 1 TsaB n=1 Tax=Bacillus ectoiniformans TaxID=1494429 RepID=UPI00195C615A|nr:tRNA (adenosine(37)-N6)-threonylcarbamoyltransferase complex dimerization subunit type 1 TsaB [Bacillus ectoiniformans]MBM7650520.1 tRNA threonylcarbamoyladenosine biosynthesis protein TsaB [Bacillus ectoiniformans]